MTKKELLEQNKALQREIEELKNRLPVTKDEVKSIIRSEILNNLTIKKTSCGFDTDYNPDAFDVVIKYGTETVDMT
jgi:cell division septum initiation protein DivIVA